MIGYKLDQEANKIIFLTQKGKKLLEKIDDIEDLILKDEDSPQAKDEDDEKKKE